MNADSPPEPVSNRPRVLLAHSGKQHAYRAALSLQSTGHLAAFVTSSYYQPNRFPDRIIARSRRWDRALRRRRLAGLRDELVHRRWRYEIPEVAARAIWGNGRRSDSFVHRRDALFDAWVARRFAAREELYWGFQGSCLESLKAARAAGRLAIAEFTIAHITAARRILSAEMERHPEWAATISNAVFPDWYRQRLEQEPREADYCIAASTFSKESLLEVGIPEERIRLLPLGADVAQFQPVPRSADGPFRILFVGGVGQRKGVKYLLEAYRRMRTASTELIFAGPLPDDSAPLRPYASMVTLLGRLDQAAVADQMRRADCLVLPSVFEGFGLVIPEAMATGLPVIASTHSAGPELIREGRDGFVIEPDDIDALAAHLDWLAGHREQAREMGQEAARRAQEFSWRHHAERTRDILGELANSTAHDRERPT